jgi:phosphoribosyl 1,2-cyclic phosphodiesterase
MCPDINLYDFRVLAKTFDFVMISHIDDDHITGILDLTRELVMAKEAHGACARRGPTARTRFT